MLCTVCGDPAVVVQKKYEDMCQPCWDSLRHELKIRLDAIREFGQYHHGNCGPTFGCTFYTGETTLGYGLYVSRTPQQAMTEACRAATRNNWKLLRLDIQGGANRLYGQSCTNIFVSDEFGKYMKYSDLGPLSYDMARYGELN